MCVAVSWLNLVTFQSLLSWTDFGLYGASKLDRARAYQWEVNKSHGIPVIGEQEPLHTSERWTGAMAYQWEVNKSHGIPVRGEQEPLLTS